MALSRVQYEQQVAGNKNFSVTMPYISKDDIKVSVAGEPVTFSWLNPQTVQLTVAPNVGQIIDIQRETERKNLLVDFQDASTITETQLDLASRQAFYLAQEAFDLTFSTMAVANDGSYSASGRRISLLGDPDSDDDAVNQGWVRAEFGSGFNAHEERVLAEAAKDASQSSASDSATSASQAADSESAAAGSASSAASSASSANSYKNTAKTYRDEAEGFKNQAKVSEENAEVWANSVNMPNASGNGLKLIRQKNDESGFEYFDITQLAELFNDVGDIKYRAGNVVPDTWMEADGRLLSRSTYAELFAVIGTTYGSTNGSNFRLPDLRGEFLRGWDNGRGVDDGRALGSHQGDAIRNITGNLSAEIGGYSGFNIGNTLGVFQAGTATSQAATGLLGYPGQSKTVTFDASRVVPTADENRPRNNAMLVLIKVKPGWP